MYIIEIHRKKHFAGALMPYWLVLNYDRDEYIAKINYFKRTIGLCQNEMQRALVSEDFDEWLEEISFIGIKNGETTVIYEEDGIDMTIFAINNNLANTEIYPFAVTEQIRVSGNTKLMIKTTSWLKGVKLSLEEMH